MARAPIIAVRRCRECHVSYTSTHSTLSSHECMHVREASTASLYRERTNLEPNYRARRERDEDRRRSTRVVLVRVALAASAPLCDGALRVFDFRQFGEIISWFMLMPTTCFRGKT